MDFLSANPFDLAIYLCLFVAVVLGFMTGLLRSLATIFGYLCGMGVAVAAAPKLTPLLATYLKTVTPQTWVVFVAAGAIIGALLRLAVSEMVGPNVSIPDRIAGALLGAFRIVLLAVLLVLVFDRIIPPGREPG